MPNTSAAAITSSTSGGRFGFAIDTALPEVCSAAMSLIALLFVAQVPIPVPIITFPAPPPLVVVQPGIQVVEDREEEVFFTDGYYWHRKDGRWFRTKEHNGKWVLVEDRVVPGGLVKLTPGAYRHYKHAEKEERREEKREWKEDKREEKREEKREKHHGKG